MKDNLHIAIDQYLDALFVKEDAVLQAVEQSIAEANMPFISVSPSQGKLLSLLVRISSARRVLEVGTLAGYSTIWMARALPAGGRLVSLEVNPRHAEVAKENIRQAGLDALVRIEVGDAATMLSQMEKEEPFDLIFIDADKVSYPVYLERCVPLCRSGSLILADNVIRAGEVFNPDSHDESVLAIQQFNKNLAADKRLEATIFPTLGVKGVDGIALAVVQ